MAVLVIRARNHLNADGNINTKRARAGDVLAILPDGHKFSARETGNADWLFWELPGVPEEKMGRLISPHTVEELSLAGTDLGREQLRAISRRRAYRLSLLRVAFIENRPLVKAAVIDKLTGAVVPWEDTELSQLVLRFNAGE